MNTLLKHTSRTVNQESLCRHIRPAKGLSVAGGYRLVCDIITGERNVPYRLGSPVRLLELSMCSRTLKILNLPRTQITVYVHLYELYTVQNT